MSDHATLYKLPSRWRKNKRTSGSCVVLVLDRSGLNPAHSGGAGVRMSCHLQEAALTDVSPDRGRAGACPLAWRGCLG